MIKCTSRLDTEEDDLWLLTPEEFSSIPDGTKLTSIFDETKIKGLDHIDQNIMYGYTSWGLLNIYSEENAPLAVWLKLSV